ncbi:hypothetical protein COBT_000924 [Conglomerata obtusa]
MHNSYCPVCFYVGRTGDKSHKQYCRLLAIPAETEAYIQTIALKKTLELISFDRRRGIEEEDKEFVVGKSVESIMTAYVNVLE